MPKSGSTALQATLSTHRRTLEEHGILYPAGGQLPKNHNALTLVVPPENGMPRVFKQAYQNDPARGRAEYRALLSGIASAARRRRFHTIILSSEMLFRQLTEEQAAQLRNDLLGLADRVDVITYLRHPAERYISTLQQALKASADITPPSARRYRPVIESYDRVGDTNNVALYQRDRLRNGDITTDFLHRMLPDHAHLADQIESVSRNETISAEAMDILQRYRQQVHPGKDNVFTADSTTLFNALGRVDRNTEGFHRPRLRPEVRERVVRSAIDLPWLLERYGIRFDGVDYERKFGRGPEPEKPRSVEEVCELDPVRRERLLMRLLAELTNRDPDAPVSFSSASGLTAAKAGRRVPTGSASGDAMGTAS